MTSGNDRTRGLIDWRDGAWWFGFGALALQRLAIGVNASAQVGVVILLGGVVTVYLLTTRRASLALPEVVLFCVLLASGTLSLAVNVGVRSNASVLSLVQVAVAYVAVVVWTSRDLGRRFLDGLVVATLMGALLAIIQYVVQESGRGFVNPLGHLPEALLLSGYNGEYSLEWVTGQATYFKPNGMIFIEPSSLSLYCGFAVVYLVARHAQLRSAGERPKLLLLGIAGVVLVLGIVVSWSVSGLIPLFFGGLVLPFESKFGRRIVLAGVVAVLVAGQFGLFARLTEKLTEGFGPETSNGLRLIYPYVWLLPRFPEHPWLGFGPGASSRMADDFGVAGLQVQPLLKVLMEYGLLGLTAFVLLIGVRVGRSRAPISVIVAVLAAYLLPGSGLPNGTLSFMLVFGMPLWGDRVSIRARGERERAATTDSPPRGDKADQSAPSS